MNTRFENYIEKLTPAKQMLAREAVQEFLHGESESVELLTSPEMIFKKMRFLSAEDEEKSYAVLMKHNYRCIDVVKVADGFLDGSAFDVRKILREALLRNATCLAICHNHPSGSKTPSLQDDNVTERARKACGTMNIRFVDHVIVAGKDYYSYRENGRIL